MSDKSYSYQNRKGIKPISWEYFHSICKALAQAVSQFNPEIVIAVGRGGYYAGTLISHILRTEIYPIRLSRRENDMVKYKEPQWLLKPPELVKGKRVLIVDEISSTGETLKIVKAEVESLGAKEIKTAVLYAHTGGASEPDYVGIISDELLLNPWDREILKDGQFIFHPEYVDALEKQSIKPESSLLIQTEELKLAKA